MTAINAASKYTPAIGAIGRGEVDLSTAPIKVVLMATYTFSAAHASMADVLAAGTQASGTGYTAGGAAVTGTSFTASGGVWTLDGTLPSWDATGGALTARYAVFFADLGTDSQDIPLACWDLAGNTDVTATDGAFTLSETAGILTLS